MRRLGSALLVGCLLSSLGGSASATPRSTTELTIEDYKGADNLLEYGPGEDYLVIDPDNIFDDDFRPPRSGSILNFLQLSDFQMVDEESPGRVEFLDPSQRSPGLNPFSAAYRPQESLTTQITEAMVRAARNTVSPITSEQLELTVLTGDNADSQQFNETRWFIDILDGTTGQRPPGADKIDPNSGIPTPGCEATPGSIYDGVRDNGQTGSPDQGFYEPDRSDAHSDGDGYSPFRKDNIAETGRDVTVRDFPNLFEAVNHDFEALGLGMPWYTAFGNHDALIQGNSSDAFFGPGTPPFLPNREMWNPIYHSIATGCFKPSNQAQLNVLVAALGDGSISDEEMEDLEASSIPIVPPDARRCYLAKDELDGGGAPAPCSSGGWIQQHMVTTGAPVGHGFAPAACPPITFGENMLPTSESALCTSYGRPPIADFFNDGYYSFSPRQGLRFVVLDTVTDECGAPVCAEGSVDDPQFRWLEAQIHQAQSQGEYVMVFSHHSLRTTRFPSTDTTEQPLHYGQRVDPENPANPQNPSGERTLEDLYCENPNVIAHVAGHEHENHVIHYPCDGTEIPPTGIRTGAGPGDFWHITTAAHIDWPQQSRMIELIDNEDGATMSLVLTMLDHAGPPNPGLGRETSFDKGRAGEQVLKLASIGRELSYNDYQHNRGARGGREDRNVILIVKRPPPGPSD